MDTMRFLRAHWTLLQKNPFHAYHYIGFAPLSSIFHQLYANSSSFPHPVAPIGPDSDWPSEIVVQVHEIETQDLSSCGNWFATGGSSNNRAIFAVWDMQTGDGTTATHPCVGFGCSIHYLAFDQRKNNVKLRTRCKCQKLCVWDITIEPFALLQEVQLKSSRSLEWWADDYSKAVSKRTPEHPDDWGEVFLSTLNDGKEVDLLKLGHATYSYIGWKFSPKAGEKVAGWSKKCLELFECISGRRCFKKYIFPEHYGDFDNVWFSPDAKSIFYSRKNTQSHGWIAGLLSSDDGNQLWSRSANRVLHVEFFPGEDKILVGTDKSICFMSLFDGCTKQSSPLTPLNISISPEKNRIAVVTREGVEMLDPVTFDRIQWHPWTDLMNIDFVDISWKHSNIVKISHRGPADQSLTFFNLLSSKPLPQDTSSEAKAAVMDLFLSPDGMHLLTRHLDDSIQLWCSISGNKIDLTGDYIDKVESKSHIEYSIDSSNIIIWGEVGNRLVIVDTTTGQAQVIRPPFSHILAATLYPLSKRIAIINRDYEAIIVSISGVVLYSLGKISSTFTSVKSIVISPLECSISLIGNRKQRYTISVFQYGTNPIHRHYRCSITTLAKFAPNGSHLLVVENMDYYGDRISLIRMSNRPMQRFIITLPKSYVGWGLPAFRLSKPITLGHRSFFRVDSRFNDGTTAMELFLDCSDGRLFACPTLRREGNMVYYGKHRLPITQLLISSLFEVSEHNIAYVNDHGQVVIVNYSGYIDRM
jgi:hypothetical protein